LPDFPDSVPVVRFDLASRTLDTAGFFKIQRPNMTITQTASGGVSITSKANPLPTVDDWALLSDGTIAFVRGSDYHIDWVAPDGMKSSSGKIPYEWQRLDEEGKAAVLDSAQKAMEAAREMAQQRLASGGPIMVSPMGGATGAPDVVITRERGGAAPPARGTPPPGGAAARPELPPISMVTADELPDYRPAFTTGASRGDPEGNLWVRTTSPVGNAGPIYFIINRQGQVIDRVQLPQGRLLVGFGRNGDAYLALRDAEGTARVERVRIR
jgi:hypothetical protein